MPTPKRDHRTRQCKHGPTGICDFCLIAEGRRLEKGERDARRRALSAARHLMYATDLLRSALDWWGIK